MPNLMRNWCPRGEDFSLRAFFVTQKKSCLPAAQACWDSSNLSPSVRDSYIAAVPLYESDLVGLC